ncbi:MAG: hypothetical protein M1330_02255, partial [Armatimonadetes bacterium]|nr:hypothetical protein [Armatimonadota bacterium]
MRSSRFFTAFKIRESDFTLPDIGLIELADAETGDRIVIDTGNERVRQEYAARMEAQHRERDRML